MNTGQQKPDNKSNTLSDIQQEVFYFKLL
jgi:hypothetical protein